LKSLFCLFDLILTNLRLKCRGKNHQKWLKHVWPEKLEQLLFQWDFPNTRKHCRQTKNNSSFLKIHAALVICGLFICEFAYMQLKNGLFSGTYPLIYSDCWSFYMRLLICINFSLLNMSCSLLSHTQVYLTECVADFD